MTIPLISIIVPCYNQVQYLNECLQSVLDQSFQDWECIIVNDGSPDNTENVAIEWTTKDARFKYLKKENGGLSSARNAGIEMAKGEWIQFLDCDDKFVSSKLFASANHFTTNDVVITDYNLFNDSKILPQYCKYINQTLSYESFLFDWDSKFSIPIHAAIFKKEKISIFNESVSAKEDWIFWLDYFKQKPTYYIIPDRLALYRIHKESMTKDFNHMYVNEEIAYSYIFENLNESLKKPFFENRLAYKNQIIKEKLNENEVLQLKNTELVSKLKSRRYKLVNIIFSIFEKNE